MLKVIKRVLRLSGDLSKRIYASFVFSFIDSIVAMFPVGAVFYTLTKIQNNKAFAGNDWLVIFGILLISLVVRMVFKYLVYSFQSTAGFEISCVMWVWAFSMSEIWGTLQQQLQLTLIFWKTTPCTFLTV